MKLIIYDEQYKTKFHWGWSERVDSVKNKFKNRYKIEIISFKKNVFNNRIFLFPYLREILLYPIYFSFIKKRLIWDLFIFNSTFTNTFSKPPKNSVLVIHCLFSLQLKKLKKIYNNFIIWIIILCLEKICSFYEKLSIQRFKLVICSREDIKRFIKTDLRVKTKCILLPQFASKEIFFKINNTKKIYDIMFIGRNSKPKWFNDLIDFSKKYPNLKIAVCWNVDNDDKNNNRENITFFWKVPKNILNQILNKSKVLFMPSYSETWPLVTIESLMSWTPVISSIEWWWVFMKNEYNWFIYKQYNGNKVYKLFQKINTHYWYFSKNALETSKKFELEKIIGKLEKIIGNI